MRQTFESPLTCFQDPAYQDRIGQRDHLTETDVNKLKAMYQCS